MLLQSLESVCPPMGIRVNKPIMCPLNDDRIETFLREFRRQMGSGRLQFIMALVPNNRKDRYDAIKKELCIEKPIPSQVVVARTVNKKQGLMSVATKIAIQVNCKLGGTLWYLAYPPAVENTMIVGIDVYHDTINRRRSVAAFVASQDACFTRYYSRVVFQEPGEEIVSQLEACMLMALRKYNEVNHRLPQKIFIYRDGVGDGQLEVVLNFELQQFLSCFSKVSSDYSPKMAVIVVKKRINTRFFKKDGPDRSGNMRYSNPPPGSCFDTVVTRPQWYDFFLVSQCVRQGTVTPTHFNVIHDTIELGPKAIQTFTYMLCHMYYNWMGTVRVPAPCQYAHKLAFLVGQSLHQPPSADLSNRLYFL